MKNEIWQVRGSKGHQILPMWMQNNDGAVLSNIATANIKTEISPYSCNIKEGLSCFDVVSIHVFSIWKMLCYGCFNGCEMGTCPGIYRNTVGGFLVSKYFLCNLTSVNVACVFSRMSNKEKFMLLVRILGNVSLLLHLVNEKFNYEWAWLGQK